MACNTKQLLNLWRILVQPPEAFRRANGGQEVTADGQFQTLVFMLRREGPKSNATEQADYLQLLSRHIHIPVYKYLASPILMLLYFQPCLHQSSNINSVGQDYLSQTEISSVSVPSAQNRGPPCIQREIGLNMRAKLKREQKRRKKVRKTGEKE